MEYNIIPTSRFKREVKRLLKRYSSLRDDLITLEKSLKLFPTQGTGLGNNCYKIRLAVRSKGKGKSAGSRIITYVISRDYEIYLLSIYDKSNYANIDDWVLKQIVKEILSGKSK